MQAIDPQELYPFELDPFQLQAIAALQAGKSVVVCAPTGSGKTLIGEYAIHAALADHRRVFYTTPLKALSNQKLRDFRHQFGDDNVGLLTGDTSVNRDAPILVMTTEIFRNMLYGTPIGEVG
ncbi:MAG: DEAD/DEAH box helicase, partial [Pseudanabaena sp.]